MTTDLLFSGTPVPQGKSCGWQERHDALHQHPEKPMPGPWHWECHDHSMVTLCGGGEDAIIGHIMSVSPCEACAGRAEPKEWKWGRCHTPNEADARLIAAAPELLAALNELASMYGSTWDRVDGALMMMDTGVERFEKAHQLAQDAIAKAIGKQ